MTAEAQKAPEGADHDVAADAHAGDDVASDAAASADAPRGEKRGRGRRGGRGGRGEGRGPSHDGGRDHGRGRHERHLDRGPPQFDVDELIAVVGAPLWQAVHDATVVEVTPVAVFVEVTPMGHEPLRAAVPAAELPGAVAGLSVRVRLGDPPRGTEPVASASVAQAKNLDALDALVRAFTSREGVRGKVLHEIKGGYAVALTPAANDSDESSDLSGAIRAFMPGSQAGLGRFGPARGEHVVDLEGTFDIAELEPERANVVVSRRARLEAERKQKVQESLAKLNEGDVAEGIVRSIMPYGAFLDVGGLDALVHQTDLSWDGHTRVASLLRVGQKVKVKVLHKNPETGKLKVGIKQLQQNPWQEVRSAFAEGSVVDGVVVALQEFGAFVRLTLPSTQGQEKPEHIVGLIHVTEMSWTRIKHPSQKLSIGQEVKVKVLGIDPESRRMSLSLKALEPNPFEAIASQFPIGTVLKVKIKQFAEFGAFVELADGVDGLIHIGEISWNDHPRHPSELLTIGQEVEVVVTNVDVARQRVGLSMKRTTEDPYQVWDRKYQRGKRIKLKVTRVDDRGAYFTTDDGLSAFCATRDLPEPEGNNNAHRGPSAKTGQELEVEVRMFDKRTKKLTVSARSVVEGDTRAAYKDYQKSSQGDTKLNPLADKLKALMEKKQG